MKRQSGYKPKSKFKEKIKLANESLNKQFPSDDLVMPEIYPLDNDSLPQLEKLIINAVANKLRISMFDCQACLQLQDGFEWCGKT